MSNHQLSDSAEFVFSHRLSFNLPPTRIKRKEVLADFEVIYAQLLHHKPSTTEQSATLKAWLNDLAD